MSSGDPLLSVVVPTDGRPGYLRGCLAALSAATYPRDRFEVVVVNDAGGPEVERTSSAFADRLDVLVTSPDRSGPSAARNAGAALARGRYLAFTDDDCAPAPGWLRALELAIERSPGAAVGGRTRNGVPQGAAAASQIVVDAVHAHFNQVPGTPRFFASNNVAFPAAPLLALGGFDEELIYAEDRELCERWVSSGNRFVHEPHALVYHMRTYTPGQFFVQHYGYGRGAFAFNRSRASGPQWSADRLGVLRRLAREPFRYERAPGASGQGGRVAVAGYLALSQLATAAGLGREAIADRLR